MKPAGAALALLVRAYQLVLRPLFPPACRFEPSCSAYAIEALQTHGALRGLWLASWRIVRCNPLCAGGTDPVPPGPCGCTPNSRGCLMDQKRLPLFIAISLAILLAFQYLAAAEDPAAACPTGGQREPHHARRPDAWADARSGKPGHAARACRRRHRPTHHASRSTRHASPAASAWSAPGSTTCA